MPTDVIMKRKTTIYICLLVSMLLPAVSVLASGKNKFDKKKTITAADKFFKEGLIFASADLYREVLDHDSTNTSVLVNLANSYYQARDYVSAEIYFARAYRADYYQPFQNA